MAWDINFPLVELAQRLIATRLRAERLRLGQRLKTIEAQAMRQGIAAQPLQALRQALQPTTLLAPDRTDPFLVLPRKPAGIWRRKYLTVTTKPGSLF